MILYIKKLFFHLLWLNARGLRLFMSTRQPQQFENITVEKVQFLFVF